MKQIATAAALAVAAMAGSAQAGVILAPATVTVDVGGVAGGAFAVDNLIDQTGLTVKYTPGVTDFDAFIGLNQTHGSDLYTRWLSGSGISTARLTFDFGREVTLSQLALWDDRSTTISKIKLSTPDTGVFRELAVQDVIQQTSYAQVFNFAAVTTRYVSFEIEGCNKGAGAGQNWSGCGLNEVVFGEGQVGGVPEPATWAMMILGFGAAGTATRRRRLAAVAA